MYRQQGDLEHTVQIVAQGLALSRAAGKLAWSEAIGARLGSAYARQGRVAEGRALIEEAISDRTRIGTLRGWHVGWLSEVCRLAGCGAAALRHARQALALSRQKQERGDEAAVLHQLGESHASAVPPDTAPAAACYQQALALTEERGMRPLQAHCQRSLGMLYARTGRVQESRAALRTAVALYRAMDMTFWPPQTEAVLAQVAAC